MLTVRCSAERTQRPGEHGFTLIEVIVSIAILAIAAGAIAAAFTAGLHAFAPGGARDRLAGAKDLSVLEQLLGRDGARAACITAQDPTSGSFIVYGQTSSTCATTTGYGKVPGCTSAPFATLCLAWPQLGTSGPAFLDSTCHIAVYTAGAPQPPATPAASGGIVTRTEYTVPLSGAFSSSAVTVDRFDTVRLQIGAASPPSYKPAGETYTWLRSLPISIVATGVASNQPGQSLALHPVAVDPDGPAAAITEDGSPC